MGERKKKGLAAVLAWWICKKINRTIGKGDHEVTKMRIGMEIILDNVFKLLFVLLLSILVGTLPETGAVFIAFALLRKNSHGIHADSNLICTLVMCVTHILLPVLVKNLHIPKSVAFAFFCACLYIFYKYAPSDTEKLPLLSKDKRTLLKRKSILNSLLVMCVALVIPFQNIRNVLLLSTMYVVVMILPITYKIFNQRRNNYEYYEGTEESHV